MSNPKLPPLVLDPSVAINPRYLSSLAYLFINTRSLFCMELLSFNSLFQRVVVTPRLTSQIPFSPFLYDLCTFCLANDTIQVLEGFHFFSKNSCPIITLHFHHFAQVLAWCPWLTSSFLSRYQFSRPLRIKISTCCSFLFGENPSL